MKADEAKKLTDDALGQLASALEAGKSESLTRYLAAMGRFHKYSFGNVLLISTQRPEATRVAGFQTWKSFGRFVKKGSHGIAIIAPMVFKKEADAAQRADDSEIVLRFKVAHVFDVADTEGEALPEFSAIAGDPGIHAERLKALVAQRGIELKHSKELGSALGMSAGGSITLAEGLAPAQEFGVLVHELAHEMLHHIPGERPESKTTRETEAEAVSYVVTQAIGLETGTAAADYIHLWSGDKATLAASLDRIQKTAASILARLELAD